MNDKESLTRNFMSRAEVIAQRNIAQDTIELYVKVRTGIKGTMDESVYFGRPLVLDRIDDFNHLIEPVMGLSEEAAQYLMDQLYRCGIRPSETGGAGEVAALKYHLEDMRKLVFNGETCTTTSASK